MQSSLVHVQYNCLLSLFIPRDQKLGFSCCFVFLSHHWKQINLKCKPLLNIAIRHKPDQNQMKNKKVTDACIHVVEN